jgi:hypothetical protein
MTMRIDTRGTVAGVPALEARHLARLIGRGDGVSARWLGHWTSIPESRALRLIRHLVQVHPSSRGA